MHAIQNAKEIVSNILANTALNCDSDVMLGDRKILKEIDLGKATKLIIVPTKSCNKRFSQSSR
jgi:hypothetical protein